MSTLDMINVDGVDYDLAAQANDGELTIQKNGVDVQTFSANQSTNVTANIEVPTKVSELTNDSGFTGNIGTVTEVDVGLAQYMPDVNGVIALPAPSTPNDGTLTIQKNGVDVQTFSANQSSNATANITVPTKVSELTNDSGFTDNAGTVTEVDVGSAQYTPDANGVISLPAGALVNDGTLTIQKNGTNVQTFSANQSSNATANITVPTKVSELTNDSGYTTNTGTVTQVKVGSTAYNPSSGVVSLPAYPTVNNATLTIQKNGTNVQTFTANQSSNATANIAVPTKVSELTNDSGYTTNTGTVTQVKVGSTAYNPSSGVVSLPAYPAVNNATLTIQKNGSNVQTFTANQSTNATANITVPTKLSDLTNDRYAVVYTELTGNGTKDISGVSNSGYRLVNAILFNSGATPYIDHIACSGGTAPNWQYKISFNEVIGNGNKVYADLIWAKP